MIIIIIEQQNNNKLNKKSGPAHDEGRVGSLRGCAAPLSSSPDALRKSGAPGARSAMSDEEMRVGRPSADRDRGRCHDDSFEEALLSLPLSPFEGAVHVVLHASALF